ncbi:MAG: ATP-binding protein [Nanoarchaeota archaeon]|nr:ATP-binding protein [Nanoarchaeota archaeon]
MIQNIIIENFLSIKKKLEINFEATATKSHNESVINLDNSKYLKTIAIYGPNASGKTNILKALDYMKWLILNSYNFNEGVKTGRIPFKLDKNSRNKPTYFEINFFIKKIKYNYSFKLDDEKIIEENLNYYPKGKITLIFSRNINSEEEFKFNHEDKATLQKIRVRPNQLFLSKATYENYKKTEEVYKFFRENIVNGLKNEKGLNYTLRLIEINPKIKDMYLEFLQKADFSIDEIIFEKKKRKVNGFEFKIDKNNPVMNSLPEQEEDYYELFLSHRNKDENSNSNLGFNEESDGTKVFFSLLGPILNILENNKILIVDELEASLHPELTSLIIEIFNNSKSRSQLLFTTHDTNVLSPELFRKDQIYFTNRTNNETDCFSLYDFGDVREGADYEKQYLDGKYGAVPTIDKRIISLIKQWQEKVIRD